ncbi:universal stress protein [Streptomyces sp. NPDC057074]|uniref:universal stress protein n=1 Tax=Streptomyces sp. NPDC057074 TaxID=3346015 RepID=UPI00363A67CC
MTTPSGCQGFAYKEDGTRSVLIGVDGTEPSFRAVDHALDEARRMGATAVGVFVRPIVYSCWAASHASVVLRDASEACRAEAAAYFGERALACGVTHAFFERLGDPAHEIAEVADGLRADLVVLGRPAGLSRHIPGSVCARLVRTARWPVLTVP